MYLARVAVCASQEPRVLKKLAERLNFRASPKTVGRADMPSILLRYLDLVYGRDPSLVLAVLRDTLNCTVGFVSCFSEFP